MLLFMDGMAHYNTAGIATKYSTRDDSYIIWSIVAEGRTGNCLKRVSTGNQSGSGYLALAPFATRAGLWTPSSGGVCGFAIKVDDLTRSTTEGGMSPYGLLVIQESGMGSPVGAGPYHLKVFLHPDGTFTAVRRGVGVAGDINLGNSIEGLQSNAWAYLEFKWLIHDTTGYFEIRVNTIPVLTYTGATRVMDAANFGYWNSVRLFTVPGAAGAPPLTMRIGDLYLADLTGGATDVKDFLGDGTVQTIFPNAPGLAAAWTPVDATANWDQVNDKPVPDGDATYVRAVIPGTRDVHQFEDIPAGSTVLAAHYNMLTRKEAEGSVTVKPVVGQAGVQYDGPTQGVASIAYDRYLTQPYDVNPATGARWTAAEINAGQWGLVKVT